MNNGHVKKKVLFVTTEDWAFISHRLHLGKSAVSAGYKVSLAANPSSQSSILIEHKINFFEWNLKRGSLNIFGSIIEIIRIFKILEYHQPDIVHAVALKPMLFVHISSLFLRKKIKYVFALGGLGHIFISNSLKARILRFIVTFVMKSALKSPDRSLILQNIDDIEVISSLGVRDKKKINLVRGAGVELEKFQVSPIPKNIPKIIMPSRLVWEKGVAEFIHAAQLVNKTKKQASFILVGEIDRENPSAISPDIIESWVQKGVIDYWGYQSKMCEVYAASTVVCLPSYREGLPKCLLEAASCGRPVVAFDVPGCREIVKHQENGLLIQDMTGYALAEGLLTLINNRELCNSLGKRGREIVELDFNSQKIASETFEIWNY